MTAYSSSSFLSSSPQFTGPKIAVSAISPASTRVRFRPPRFAAVYTSAERLRTPHLRSSNTSSSSASLYELLGIPMGSTGHEIKSAYRRLVRVCHPDVAAVDRKDSSADEFMKIHAAYLTLSDPEKRADYDRNLFRWQRPVVTTSAMSASTMMASASSSVSGFSGYTRRTWETDQCW